jgi:hypothetical protein
LIGLPEKLVAIDHALRSAGLPHAFGGALALAWCTQRARGTIDLDVNVFVDAARAAEVFTALPDEVGWSDEDVTTAVRDGQVRLWWAATPIDVFLNTTEFHAQAADRAVDHEFLGEPVAFLACRDLAVFKAFFNRTQDWADLEAMLSAGALDVEAVLGVLTRYLGGDDERVARLRALDA